MTYEQFIDKRQAEFDKLPIFYAFDIKQFTAQLEMRNAKISDVCSIGHGGYCLKKDKDIVLAFLNAPDELPELMKDEEFAIDAFYYEMSNHEYQINHYQGNWDVLNCFADKELKYIDADDYHVYLNEMGHPEWLPIYEKARKKYLDDCDKNNWY